MKDEDALHLIVPQNSHKYGNDGLGDDIVESCHFRHLTRAKRIEGNAHSPYEHIAQGNVFLLHSEGVEHPSVVDGAVDHTTAESADERSIPVPHAEDVDESESNGKVGGRSHPRRALRL